MAPSNKCFLILLLISFAVIAPNLPPSSATRATEAPAPSANGELLHPEAEFSIPDLPIPALLPCPPLFPKIPLIPCYIVPSPAPPPSPEVKECRSSLKKLMPCGGFLTDKSVFAPPCECCASLDAFYEDGTVLACLCHLANGDITQLLPGALNRRRTGPLLIACDFKISPNEFYDVCSAMKDRIPPMDLPSPSPSA